MPKLRLGHAPFPRSSSFVGRGGADLAPLTFAAGRSRSFADKCVTKLEYRASYRVGAARVGQWSNEVSLTVAA